MNKSKQPVWAEIVKSYENKDVNSRVIREMEKWYSKFVDQSSNNAT